MSNFLKKLFSRREVILLIIIIIIITILGFTTEFFFTMQNFRAMMLIISVNSILAAAMTVLFISGGFDLSAGSVMATVGIVLGILLINDVPIILAIIISLIFGIAIGSGIGAIIAIIGVNPFVATLGAMFIFRGIAFVIGEAREDATGVGTPSFTNFPESDFIIEVSWRYMIPQKVVEKSHIAAFGIHRGKLPEYAGAEPIKQALHNHENEIILSAHNLNAGIDEGEVFATISHPVTYDNSISFDDNIPESSKGLR